MSLASKQFYSVSYREVNKVSRISTYFNVAKEIDDVMRGAAQQHLHPTTCVFKDILDIWCDAGEAKTRLNSLSSYPDKVAAAWQLPCSLWGYCFQHGQYCCYHGGEERLRVQGPPCVDWSTAGNQRGISGENFPTMLAAGAKANATATSLVALENVVPLPPQVVTDSFGNRFDFRHAVLSPAQVGFEFMSRDRPLFYEFHCFVIFYFPLGLGLGPTSQCLPKDSGT